MNALYRIYCSFLSFVVVLMFLALFVSNPANAQHDFIFKHLNVEQGLSQSSVGPIIKDCHGFMWFGSHIGLNKYDGYEFTVYQHELTDTTTLTSNYISQLFEDSRGNLWVGTADGGLNMLDRNKDIFYRYKHDPNNNTTLSSDRVRDIYEDDQGNLLIATAGGGVNHFDWETKQFTLFYEKELFASLNSKDIGSVKSDSKGNIWIASTEGKLSRLDAQSKKFKTYELYTQYTGAIYSVLYGNIFIDDDDIIWYGSEIGLFKLDPESNDVTHFQYIEGENSISSNAVTDIEEYENNELFITTDHGGLNIYNKSTGLFRHIISYENDASSLSCNQLYSVYKDNSGIVWIGTYRGGVNILDKRSTKFKKYKDLLKDEDKAYGTYSVIAFCEDRDGNLWIGNDGQGVDVYNKETRDRKHYSAIPGSSKSINSDIVTALYRANNGDIWIGYWLGGMSIYRWETKRFEHFTSDPDKNSISGNNIWDIQEDLEGNVWIGTIGKGLNKFDPSEGTYTHFVNDENDVNSITNNDIFKILLDSKGKLWFCTRQGISVLDPLNDASFLTYKMDQDNENSLLGGWVNDIYESKTGEIWIGTDMALNLFLPDVNGFQRFGMKEGLPSNAISAIQEDGKGNLWISTINGLASYNPTKKEFRTFDVTDGLQGNEFNYTSVFKDSEGQIYFGGTNGFNVFNPDSISQNIFIPPVYVTEFQIFNKTVGPSDGTNILSEHVNFTDSIVLNHKQNSISFKFTSLNFSYSHKNRYYYMLEGFDDGWVFAGGSRVANYTNLHPGEYVFKVQGSNNDGLWNREAKEIYIVIYPPFYLTPWFYILCFILGVLGIYGIIKLREKQLVLQNKHLEDKVEVRTMEVQQKNREIQAQADHLEMVNEKVKSSLRYAKRIQVSMLPTEGRLRDVSPDSFVFFRPRDIVSGDFYWMLTKGDDLFIAAADCTGHGVPGGFMSMTGNATLNEIVNSKDILEPSDILRDLNNIIYNTLNKNNDEIVQEEGMDITLCRINRKEKKLWIASANQNIIVYNGGEQEIINGDQRSIGGLMSQRVDTDFINHEFEIKKGLTIYMASDGYQDQYGGENNRKFLVKNFYQLIDDIHKEKMENQLKAMEKTFNDWKGDRSQIDDVLVIGFRL